MKDFRGKMEFYRCLVDKNLREILEFDGYFGTNKIVEAAKYSIFSGGKRIRPIVVLATSGMFGVDTEMAIKSACCIELIHTYSLIHDDLPCMDDDDYRRGIKTNHIVFGEDIAVLTGDALLTLAFEIISNDTLLSDDIKVKIIREISVQSGMCGMIAGQVADMHPINITEDSLREMHLRKTGALISASARIGGLLGYASEDDINLLSEYGKCLGLAFQICDDVLDIEANTECFGRPLGSDIKNGKVTFPDIIGVDKCIMMIGDLTEQAINCIIGFENNIFLRDLALHLVNRRT